MKTNNIITTAINYTALTLEKSKDFDQFKHIEISDNNPLMIKYIKQDKIQSLKDFQNIDFVNSKKQKNYLDETSIIKLLNKMFKAVTCEEVRTINEVGDKINKLLKTDSVKDLQFFIYDDVPTFYNQENCQYKTLKNGSCMEGKPIEYFGIYNKFINTKTQIVGLRKGSSVVARGILWTKSVKEPHIFGNDTEPVEVEKKLYFLDKIYIASQFENDLREQLQASLWAKTRRALRVKKLNCASSFYIKNYYDSKKIYNKSNADLLYNYPEFDIQITQSTFNELDFYPYIDTFRFFRETTNNFKSCGEDDCSIIFDMTEGNYSEGEEKEYCEHSGEYHPVDECRYSEVDGCYYHEEFAIYCEERSDYINVDNAVYNEYTGDYHYRDDLNI